MASFKIEWKGSSERDIRNIDKQHIHRILNAVEALSENPFPAQFKKLQGSESSYRIRIGDYRVIIDIDKQNLLILIIKIGHRKNIYEK